MANPDSWIAGQISGLGKAKLGAKGQHPAVTQVDNCQILGRTAQRACCVSKKQEENAMSDDSYGGMPALTTKNNLKDGRSMKRNGRVHQLNLKFSLAEIDRIKKEAEGRGVAMNALIVRALELFFATHQESR
jgi:hypothetical protein